MKPNKPVPPTAMIPKLFHVIGPLPLPAGGFDEAVQNRIEFIIGVDECVFDAGCLIEWMTPLERHSDDSFPNTVRDIV